MHISCLDLEEEKGTILRGPHGFFFVFFFVIGSIQAWNERFDEIMGRGRGRDVNPENPRSEVDNPRLERRDVVSACFCLERRPALCRRKERHPPSKVTGHHGLCCQDLVKERQSCYCCAMRALQQMNDKEFQEGLKITCFRDNVRIIASYKRSFSEDWRGRFHYFFNLDVMIDEQRLWDSSDSLINVAFINNLLSVTGGCFFI